MPQCSQIPCPLVVAYEYFWPGRRMEYACAGHAGTIQHAATVLGLVIHMTLVGSIAEAQKIIKLPAKPGIET